MTRTAKREAPATALRQHIDRVTEVIGAYQVDVLLDHRGVAVWRGIRPGSPDADQIRVDAEEHGLRYCVPWAAVDEVEVTL